MVCVLFVQTFHEIMKCLNCIYRYWKCFVYVQVCIYNACTIAYNKKKSICITCI